MAKEKNVIWIVIAVVSILGLVAVSGVFYAEHRDWKKAEMRYKAESCYNQILDFQDTPCPEGKYCTMQVGMPNPSSYFCNCIGGNTDFREDDSGQYGMCVIDGKEVEEWDLLCQWEKDLWKPQHFCSDEDFNKVLVH